MICFVTGDLFATPGLDALAHGCNRAGAMGRGIAVEFRRRFPAMYEDYRRRCASREFQLGSVFAWKAESLTLFNLGTQASWRTRAELSAIGTAVGTMLGEAQAQGIRRIGLPRIGAGLGGLDWRDVKAVLERLAQSSDVELLVFEEYVKA